MAVAEAVKPAAASPAKAAAVTTDAETAPVKAQDLEVLSRQLVLALSVFAALAAFACAVLAKRPYLSAAFCASVAALCIGAVGTMLSKLIVVPTGETSGEDAKTALKQ
jgi:hypothetical protein